MEVALVLSCCLTALLLYLNTLQAEFAYDDSRAIKTNPDVLPSSPILQLFLNDFWGTPLTHSGSHKSYRPLTVLSFRLNYLLGGFEPLTYHATNVLLHVLATFLFATLTKAIAPPQARVFGAAAPLLFAAHPVHTEAVAGVVGRADVGAAIFLLLALISYIRHCRGGSYRGRLCKGSACKGSSRSCSDSCSSRAPLPGRGPSGTNQTSGRPSFPPAGPRVPHAPGRAPPSQGTHSPGPSLITSLPSGTPPPLGSNGPQTSYRPQWTIPRWGCGPYLWVAVLCSTLSMLCKETGIAALGLCAVHRLCLHSRARITDLPRLLRQGRDHPTLWGNLGVLGVSGAVLVGARLLIMGSLPPEFSPADNPAADCDDGLVRTLTFLFLPAFNFWLLLCPTRLSFDWSMGAVPLVASASDPRNLGTLLFYGCLGALGFRYLSGWGRSVPRRGGGPNNGESSEEDVVILGLALLVLPFIPATNLFFYVGFVVAERLLYIPSMGFCLLVSWGIEMMLSRTRSPMGRRLLKAGVVLLFVVHATKTWRRNFDWRTEEQLYRSGIPINPPKAYGNLANILSARGQKAEAEWAYKRALAHRSNMADVHYNLGILLQEQKRHEESVKEYALAIQYRPRMAMAHLNLGLVLGLLGRQQEAEEVYRQCAELDGSGLKDPRTHEATKISALFNLGRLYADDGRYERAIEVYLEAVRRMPAHYTPQSLYNMLGEAHFKLGRVGEAERWYEEALRAKPDHVPAHLTYAKLLATQDRLDEAEVWFKKALSLAPTDPAVHQHYGQFLSETGRHDEAANHYVEAASLSPSEYETTINAANTLRQAGRNAEAERYYRAAVALRPQDPTSHMNLGAMLHVNGRLREAEASYLQALRLKPDDAVTSTNLHKLRHLLKKGVSAA
ncbi:protein O-mannosyl-transferase TMTC2 isoform X2 [Hyalella azteca]|uniref:dolichyl-phosphate-mannose--protein mannosyltransferase n=1 Tax=Hyalella azteca TaxID=294128 RepID=A0A8B7N9S0_HYAAZ|nr:protein O-mannosyl-transferase TMTC2 isoform X1 [Hyalella azteca]XP_047739460.1 protein O-mannosyl-transferase TMTC2 isoform X2 [Hyalella azteca]